jgi:hypothetical protein
MRSLFNRLPWWLAFVLVLTPGLAPFIPEPHLVEKLSMLSRGELRQAVDIFDLLFHASPFAILFCKLFFRFTQRNCP